MMMIIIIESLRPFSNVDENTHSDTRQHKIIMCWADVQSENLLCKMFGWEKQKKQKSKQEQKQQQQRQTERKTPGKEQKTTNVR